VRTGLLKEFQRNCPAYVDRAARAIEGAFSTARLNSSPTPAKGTGIQEYEGQTSRIAPVHPRKFKSTFAEYAQKWSGNTRLKPADHFKNFSACGRLLLLVSPKKSLFMDYIFFLGNGLEPKE